MSMTLEKEFSHYKSHQDELVRLYGGKFIVIVGEKVITAHDSELEAYESAKQTYPLGSFLIQHCQPGEESYTQTFHSRVAFR